VHIANEMGLQKITFINMEEQASVVFWQPVPRSCNWEYPLQKILFSSVFKGTVIMNGVERFNLE
jgi:hypothetical protein